MTADLGAAALTHLELLEAEGIHIIREVVAQSKRPVMLYSIGKASTVVLHLARKAFCPGITPFSLLHADMWKTEGLRQALEQCRFDAAIGGASRDEEKNLPKECVFSFRSANHRRDPQRQKPELWNLYDAKITAGQSIGAFQPRRLQQVRRISR